ncbi:MAG: methyltransferase domain-containing protein [Candidatus Moranbacteria bacterium]|nr:methyltransferase domain-containing protein [Candidatus Moranbacteria bacterium]
MWYVDKYLPYVHPHFKKKKTLLKKTTPFQTIEIMDLEFFGKSCSINGIPQSSEKDEWVYHECLIHPAMLLLPEKKKLDILILGTGEGATARELLKYKNVAKITSLDIDREVVKVFKKHFPEVHQGSFNNPKIKFVTDSAGNFLNDSNEEYDLIISDITDVEFFDLGAKAIKSQKDFYSLIKKHLRPEGVLAMHSSEITELEYKKHFKLKRLLQTIFPAVYSYRYFMPYFSNVWGFLLAFPHKKINPQEISEQEVDRKIRARGLKNKLKLISGRVFRSLFTFSPYLQKKEKKL